MITAIPRGDNPPLDLTVRVGCEMVYEAQQTMAAFVALRPRRQFNQQIQTEEFVIEPPVPSAEDEDSHGNIIDRYILQPGRNRIRHDALVSVSSIPENTIVYDELIPIEQLPISVLRYTLPSRYCDSDKLMNFAAEHFLKQPPGIAQVQAVCTWLHRNIEYRFGSGRPDSTASEIVGQGYGVCRDFAHTAVALCRALSIPARYVTGHVPDIAFIDPGTPMDFHAYMEVYLGHHWHTFDARFNTPRIGRIKIACGMDAVDGAFATIFGNSFLSYFAVWAYQVDPRQVRVGDPLDFSKRLDGTLELKRP